MLFDTLQEWLKIPGQRRVKRKTKNRDGKIGTDWIAGPPVFQEISCKTGSVPNFGVRP
jgi:hypothetical protein